jgi:hypothetical protein
LPCQPSGPADATCPVRSRRIACHRVQGRRPIELDTFVYDMGSSSASRTHRRAMTRRRCRPAGCKDFGIPDAGNTQPRPGCVRRDADLPPVSALCYLPGDAGHVAIAVMTKRTRASLEDVERTIAHIARYAYDYFLFTADSAARPSGMNVEERRYSSSVERRSSCQPSNESSPC